MLLHCLNQTKHHSNLHVLLHNTCLVPLIGYRSQFVDLIGLWSIQLRSGAFRPLENIPWKLKHNSDALDQDQTTTILRFKKLLN